MLIQHSMKHYRGLNGRNLTLLDVNIKGANQPAHLLSLIKAFVICYLESIVVKLAPGKISTFQLVFVSEQAGLYLP